MTDQPLDWGRVFRLEAGRLTRFLRRFGPAVSPEDITQDSFLRVCETDPTTVTSPRGLLYQTARNLALNQIKRARIAPEQAVSDIAALADERGSASSPEEAIVSTERVVAIQAAIDALPEALRTALLLRKLERLSPQEIGQRLGVSPRQVQRLIVQAIERVQAALAEDDNDDTGR